MTDTLTDPAGRLAAALIPASLSERLGLICRAVGRAVMTTSFGPEDQALTHAIAAGGHPIDLITLDTGRHFSETYDLWAETEARYGLRIRGFSPDTAALETLIGRQGVNGFRASVAARQACCAVRKVAPLGRALAGAEAWITGLRAEQSSSRSGTTLAERDAAHGLIKVNPLADWSRARLVAYLADHDVPVSPLHARGFASIGCAPCTRAVAPGEPERAGRWWWEQGEDKKECGLHRRPAAPPAPAGLTASAA